MVTPQPDITRVLFHFAVRPGCLLHVSVDLLAAALVLQARLGQVNREHTGDPHHACNASIDQLSWKAAGEHRPWKHTHTRTH